MKKKLQKKYPRDCNLLIEEDLWQARYQILSKIFLKEFIKLNVNTDTITKNVKIAELNISIATLFLNTQIFKMIYLLFFYKKPSC